MHGSVQKQMYAARARARRAPPAANRTVAYLINQYPKVSHSFIRREILALEEQGWSVFRVALRGWDAELVDPADIAEQAKTTFVLDRGPLSLAMAVVRQAVRVPGRLLAALRLSLQMMRPSDRPALRHLIYLAEACWIAAELARRKIRHLHAHFGTNSAEVAMLVGALLGISYSFTLHGTGEYDKATLLHLAEKVKRAAFVVVVCSYVRGQIFRITPPQHWHKVKVVRCGIDAGFAGAEISPPPQNNRLVCVGRLCEEKGQILLLGAIETLVKEGRALDLVLVGDGEHRALIEGLIADLDLADSVTITGWATAAEVKRHIVDARALILPSFAEGLPIVIIEAMLLGRPVLSTYVAGIPELVVDDETGWLFQAGSEEDIARAVRACLDAPADKLQAMGTTGRKRALRDHDVGEQAVELAALFETAIGRESETWPAR
ncbi:MAG: glycosyltransferase [Pseudolabrys sp.]